MNKVLPLSVLATVVGALLWGFTGAFWVFGVPAFALVGWVAFLMVIIHKVDRNMENAVSDLAKAQKAPIRFNGKRFG